jgi:hypothetical protein
MKSAYGINQAHRFNQDGRELWGKLWRLKLHERLKMLLWRVANDILPTRARMKQLFEVEDVVCPCVNYMRKHAYISLKTVSLRGLHGLAQSGGYV